MYEFARIVVVETPLLFEPPPSKSFNVLYFPHCKGTKPVVALVVAQNGGNKTVNTTYRAAAPPPWCTLPHLATLLAK